MSINIRRKKKHAASFPRTTSPLCVSPPWAKGVSTVLPHRRLQRVWVGAAGTAALLDDKRPRRWVGRSSGRRGRAAWHEAVKLSLVGCIRRNSSSSVGASPTRLPPRTTRPPHRRCTGRHHESRSRSCTYQSHVSKWPILAFSCITTMLLLYGSWQFGENTITSLLNVLGQ